MVQKRTDAQKDVRDSFGNLYYSTLDLLKTSFSQEDGGKTYLTSIAGRMIFQKELSLISSQKFKNDAGKGKLTHLFVKCLQK